jgi:acetone monooxygenase
VPEGIQTSDGKVHEADVIILAVGFDAGSGALSRIDIRGRDGRSLKDRWKDEIRTAMGLQVQGYPNLFTTGAPLAPSAALCNMTTCLQQQVDWITECIVYARKNSKQVVEATQLGQAPRRNRGRDPRCPRWRVWRSNSAPLIATSSFSARRTPLN